MAIDFNTEPYYDDFNESKRFLKILYRPGYAVQARELTQMQTILQNQISRFGDHVFKEGSLVIPGAIGIDTKIGYVKLEATYSGVLADTVVAKFNGLIIENATGVQAQVIHYTVSGGADAAALYIRYLNSGDNNTTKTFSNSDILTNLAGTNSAGTEITAGQFTVQAATSSSTGLGSLATIQQGVYYIKGHFVLVPEQTIILDKFTNTPSYRVGLTTSESIVTAEEDGTLFDNAQNSFNYAAPGAHRYYIDAVLTKLSLDSILDTDFIELLRTGGGQTQKIIDKSEYSYLEKEFAHRTYDESGNYTVKNFEIDVRDYRNNNRGAWVTGRVYLNGDVVTNAGYIYVAKNSGTSSNSTPPTHSAGLVYDGSVSGVGTSGIQWEYTETPYYNRGVYTPGTSENLGTQQANEAKLAIGLEPGKAYVQGYEIEKPSTEYVTVQKARDTVAVNNAVIPATVGNYVLVTNINGAPGINTLKQVTLYNRVSSAVGNIGGPSGATAVGTARVRFMEYHNGTIGSQNAIYKLGLFDVKMNSGYDFNRDVKSVYHVGSSSDVNLNFTADVERSTAVGSGTLVRLIGSAFSGSIASPSSSTTIIGNSTSFDTDVKAGDYIMLGTTLRRVATKVGQNEITVDTAITCSGVTIDRVETQLLEPENTSLLFPFPYYAIESISDTVYTVYETFTSSVSAGSISISTASGTMASAADQDNYTVIDTDATSGGAIVAATASPSGANATIAVSTGLNGRNVFVIAAVNKSGASLTQKTKTLVPSATKTFTTAAEAQQTELLLGKGDAYRLISVKMKSGTFASPGATYSIDILDRFIFDDGQRPTHYDQARLILKNSFAPPEAPIEVTFDYFTHGTGDYFTKDSYPASIQYGALPYFQGVALRDVIDFRPKIDDEGTGYTGTNPSVTLLPKRGIDIITDFSYYLARKTKIAVDFGGNFFAVDGVSSLNPGEPLDPNLGLVLYNLTLEPYTFGTLSRNVQVERIDNRRYTMRDIGKLEKRIDNLEYYTSLSLLEQQTESLNIIDADGLDRFKNGFIVDNFSGHNTGDTTSPDYLCSIDMEKGELRPFYAMQNVNLVEGVSADSDRAAANYKLYGDVITLPVIADLPLITQSYASRLENINPFAVFTFLGDVKINPSSDDWFETDRRPDIVIDIEGNFTTVATLAEKAGVLGTVWNAWQNQWSGTSTVTTQNFETGGRNWVTWGTITTTATPIGQSRTGIKTNLVTKIDRQVVADRVLSTATIPYIRSRNILVQIQKLKPNTRFYPFFDGIDISAYCTPASKIEYTPSGATTALKLVTHDKFDSQTNVGSNATAAARRIAGDSEVCLNRGDVITGGTSGATAVVVGKEYNPDANTYALYVVNIQGTFSTSETITASNPLGYAAAATGTVGTVTTKALGSTLITNFNGELNLLFSIPNNDSLRFRCGSRELKLVDVSTANGTFTSRARSNYRAEGVLETKQRTVNAVRNAELAQEPLEENRVITETSQRVVSNTAWWDPLAQTFLVDQAGGAFLSKVDIFFATKDSSIPVTLEIREVVNGYPGKRVLPFSRVTIKPEKVNLSTSTVLLDGVDVNSYDTPTTFTFPSPVYVQENTEYAIVLASDSNNYRVWISQVGDQMPGTARTISEQPYLGSLFKSQNSTTWTADQTQDLKFTIYRCQFETGVNSNIVYENDALSKVTLASNPFETRNGVAKVRVWHNNHGIPSGSFVTISGVTADVNGIAFAGFNTTHTISDVDLDSYCITLGSNATASGYSGGTTVKATRHMQFDAVQPSVQIQSFSETPITFGFKGTSGKSVDSTTQTSYDQDADYIGVLANETNYFESPRMIASEQNEANADLANGLNGDKSAYFNIVMSSTNDALSPIIDTHRTSLIAISNKVNNPLETNLNVASLDYNVILSNATGVTISGSTITTSTQQAAFKIATVGKYLTIAGASSGTSTKLITAVAADGTSITFDSAPTAITGNATLTQRERFVAENAPSESSTYSKYITKRINLANHSNYIRVRFAANIPSAATVEVWYKTNIVGSNVPFGNAPYLQMTIDAAIPTASNGEEQFYDASYSLDDLIAFDAVQVKIVMKSSNSSEIPRIKDLRIIACV
ncbi:Domain of unknown function DUF4815 [uncultured Caudovirales phage]|uniref:DUF4815 domain-containing protein n=1 Tax=uncultured Caudovirales phage TaxID=2100421 RepID=A0A6J5PTD6_9CAUD|nr:Domain of unknown function DUF4815 [uncultured Caudovirales phage]CAB4182121.1 Domain of unknown function DUF4815 [uncultured Caudovirales phage]CAB4198643.1 Domain of unknown function DUF4815 [uncultured Caudovirales phage]CAB4211545.1 Domain of unknown function DUF4815 [uncultured Caudovirales phage]CAB5238658.1 Domain of unknown function DUF4815 [uncultured Caudovirales phage]